MTLNTDSADALRTLVAHAHPPRQGERDHRGYRLLTASELAVLSGLPKDRLEMAVAELADLGYVGPDYSSPHAPYRFGTVLLTPAGRAAYEAGGRLVGPDQRLGVRPAVGPEPQRKQERLSGPLLAIEALLVFLLGVFGDKVADLLDIDAKAVVGATFLLVVLMLLVAITRARHETGQASAPYLKLKGLKRLALGRMTTVFPIALLAGITIGFFCVVLLRGTAIRFANLLVYDYEIVSSIAGLTMIYAISSRNRELTLVLTFALGLSLGFAAVFTLLRPFQNSPIWTLGGLIAAMVLPTLLINSSAFHNFVEGFRRALQPDRGTRP